MAWKFCPHCEARLPAGLRYCTRCGATLADGGGAVSAPEPLPEPTPEPMPEPTPEPMPEPTPEPIPEPEPELMPEPVPEPEPMPEPAAAARKPDEPLPVPRGFAPSPEPDYDFVPAAEPTPRADRTAARRSRPLSVWSSFWSVLALSLPGVGLLVSILWSCGAARREGRRHLAQAFLLLKLLCLLLLVLLAICTRLFFAPLWPELPRQLDPAGNATAVFDLLGFGTGTPSGTSESAVSDPLPEGLPADAEAVLNENGLPLAALLDGGLTVADVTLIVDFLRADDAGRAEMGMSPEDIAAFEQYIVLLHDLVAAEAV